MRCEATNLGNGQQCRGQAMRGGKVCRKHGGSAPQVRAKAEIRYELSQWVLGDRVDDPGETMLKLITQSRRRADAYALELARVSAGYETLQEALVGDSLITGMDGSVHKAGEYIRGLVVLEAQERDRAFNFASKAVAAGLEERRVRVTEQQAGTFAAFVRAVIESAELGLSPAQQEVALVVASNELRLLAFEPNGGHAGPEEKARAS